MNFKDGNKQRDWCVSDIDWHSQLQLIHTNSCLLNILFRFISELHVYALLSLGYTLSCFIMVDMAWSSHTLAAETQLWIKRNTTVSQILSPPHPSVLNLADICANSNKGQNIILQIDLQYIYLLKQQIHCN